MNRINCLYFYLSVPPIKPTCRWLFFPLFLILTALFSSPTYATVDPLASPNNKFGIHIISATPDESSPAAQLVNSQGGDWGYVTVLVESRDRKHDKWQLFFDDLRRRHLIPLVRLATEPENNFWKRPYEGEEIAWADFLDNLVWPTKNRYVIIYNEPNQGQEWAGEVDAKSYAQTLDKTISALKNKNPDFFVLNAGLDASAPHKPPLFEEELAFLKQMNEAVPGIFTRLDGWVSHSYPNPGFAGSPDAFGKGTVRTWEWELQTLKSFKVNQNLPVFITETGWKHAEGINFDKSLPSSDIVATYFTKAFSSAWNSSQIAAVSPFLLNYQEAPFDHFSFKKLTGEPQNLKILGISYPGYYPQYQVLTDMPKTSGHPVQEYKAILNKGTIYPSVVAGEDYYINLTFKNTGQSIWGEYENIKLQALEGKDNLGMDPVKLVENSKIEPGQEATFKIHLKAPLSGTYKVTLQLFQGNQPFDQLPLSFYTTIKSPVSLMVNTSLAWKNNFSGKYLLSIISDALSSTIPVELGAEGSSLPIEDRYLLPDYTFNFTLYKPFYKPKTITARVQSGLNQLNFGMLEPDFFSALLHPQQLWKLLPWGN